ncbi:hypothetical protein K6U71_17235, partial [Vibrio alginolyticus]|nr:hypothetical protein [Vibrio alginolyticus]
MSINTLFPLPQLGIGWQSKGIFRKDRQNGFACLPNQSSHITALAMPSSRYSVISAGSAESLRFFI